MINIDNALKTIYKNDRLPLTDRLSDKDMIADFTSLGLTVAADQFAEDKGEFELTESICTDNQIKFGKCNASQVKFTLANVTDAIKEQEFSLTQKVNSIYEMPYGIFTVDTCPKQDDLIFKDVTAYDRMKKIDKDVATWYNGLTFPMNLAAFRASFLAYVGLEEDTSMLPLPNDSMTVEKTLDNPAQLSGRMVIESEEELQGAFGHINRYGKFAHTVLMPSYGLYPSLTLYPSNTLFPVSAADSTFTQGDLIAELVATYENVKFEEYTVKEISKLQIRQEDGDVGVVVGDDKGHILISKSGTSITYDKAEDAKIEISKVEGAYQRAVTVQGKNLFDKNRHTPDHIIEADGSVSASSGWNYSDYISILPNTQYCKNVTWRIIFYTASKIVISALDHAAVFTTPANAYYAILDFQTSELDTLQLELGPMTTSYEPFIPNSPSPDYPAPITIPSNFDVVACGKNIIDSKASSSTLNGITYTVNPDKTITATGIRTGTTYIGFLGELNGTTIVFTLKAGVTYYSYSDNISCKTSMNTYPTITPSGFTPTEDMNCVFVYYEVNDSDSLPKSIYPMITIGSASTAYEPYKSNKVIIPYELGALPNGIKDTIEKGTDGKTRLIQRIGKIVFDGSSDEGWVSITTSINGKNRFGIPVDNIKMSTNVEVKANVICDKFCAKTEVDTWFNNDGICILSYINDIVIYYGLYANLDQFKTWLASNPVTVYYELVTPIETIIPDLYLTSYTGVTNITTDSNPQVNVTANFLSNTDNTYVIQGNFLVYGKSAAELELIACNAFGNMAKRPYRPFESNNIGLPYIEVGDAAKFETEDPVVSYVLSRTLKGIQALTDNYKAGGSELQTEQSSGTSYEIQQLKGKTNKIVKTVDQLSVSVSDTEKKLTGEIDVLAGQVVLKVDANGNIASVELDGDPSTGTSIKLKADNIDLTGYVTLSDLSGSGKTEINGSNIITGTIDASKVKVINLDADNITAGEISGDKIKGGEITTSTFKTSGDYSIAHLANGLLEIDGVNNNKAHYSDQYIRFQYPSGTETIEIEATTGFIKCTSISVNGYKPITTENIDLQSVSYANTAHYSETAGSAAPNYDWRYAIMTNMNALASHDGYSLPVSWPIS